MKTLSTLAVIATLFSANVFAQTGPTVQALTITVTSNTTGQPVSTTLEFLANGNRDFDAVDSTDMPNPHISFAGNTEQLEPVFPFTLTHDKIFIDRFNSMPVIDRNLDIDLGIKADFDDTVTIHAAALMGNVISNLPYNEIISAVYLEDLNSGEIFQILNNNATVAVPLNTGSDLALNYTLHVTVKPRTLASPVTCFDAANGSISFHNPHDSQWTCTMYLSGVPVLSSLIFSADTVLNNLQSNYYDVTIYNGEGFLADSERIFVSSPAEVIANFTIASGNSAEINDAVLFTNTSSGADSYNWSFGDSTFETLSNPNHTYTATGTYAVTLTAMNDGGCISSFTDSILVSNPALFHQLPHIADRSSNSPADPTLRTGHAPDVNIVTAENKITLNQNATPQQINIQVLNANGQLISTTSTTDASFTLELPGLGIYIINIASSTGEVMTKKIIASN
jgi:PKD repeat protein